MHLITEFDIYNGGETEVAILNKLALCIRSHMKTGTKEAFIKASGVQSNMKTIAQVVHKDDSVIEIDFSEYLTEILSLRKVSKGRTGCPWFEFDLTVRFDAEIEVYYAWDKDPKVDGESLSHDLELFPRAQAALPSWYAI